MTKIDLTKLTETQKNKLIELGLRALIDKIDIADFPTPTHTPVKRKKHWTQTPEGRRRMSEIMSKRRNTK